MLKPPEKLDIPFGRPWIDDEDRRAVMEVLEGHILTHGPRCKDFEAEFSHFIGGGRAVTTSSCMAALHLAAIHLEISPGDEVIVPAQTHVATVHAVELRGGIPKFADCELNTGNIDISKLEQMITSKTKAIFVVHFAGIPANMKQIQEIAGRHQIAVVEDCALALGATCYAKHVGLWGDIGCFSFYPVKHMTTAEGGMLISKHSEMADQIARLRAFNVDRSFEDRKVPGVYDVIGVGLNYRMSELQAALGRTQLKKMPASLAIRKKNFLKLSHLLQKEGLQVLDSTDSNIVNSYYCLVAILPDRYQKNRDQILLKLMHIGIGCSVYYPQPVPRMKYYREKYVTPPERFMNASVISDGSISLPVGPHLNTEHMETIAHGLISTLRSL